jgi:hypothetical protein
MMQKIVNQPARLIRFHKSFGLASSREEQLFFHPVDEDLSPGTPNLTEKLRRVSLASRTYCENGLMRERVVRNG